MRSWSRSVFFAAALMCANVAWAAPKPGAPVGDAALAESLFQEGRQLMSRGKTAEACAKLAESQRLEPATGTLLNLAACHEAEGKLASAWAELTEAIPRARLDGRADREAYAKKRIAELEPQLARLTITVETTAQQPDLTVALDGITIGPAAWGVAAPIDPGAHEVRASAPGKREWKTRVEVTQKGQQLKVLVPALDADLASASPPLSPPPPTGPAQVVTHESTSAPVVVTQPSGPPPGRSHVRRNTGIVLLSVGAASVAAGAVFGVRAYNFWKERQDACPRDMCTPQAVRAHDDASTSAKISNAAFGAGLLTAAVGTYLIFSASDDEQTASVESAPRQLALLPFVGAKSGGVEVACRF